MQNNLELKKDVFCENAAILKTLYKSCRKEEKNKYQENIKITYQFHYSLMHVYRSSFH